MNGNDIPASYLAKFERDMEAYFKSIGVQKKPRAEHDQMPDDVRAFVRNLD